MKESWSVLDASAETRVWRSLEQKKISQLGTKVAGKESWAHERHSRRKVKNSVWVRTIPSATGKVSHHQFLHETKLEPEIKLSGYASQLLSAGQGYSLLRSQLKHHFLKEVFSDLAPRSNLLFYVHKTVYSFTAVHMVVILSDFSYLIIWFISLSHLPERILPEGRKSDFSTLHLSTLSLSHRRCMTKICWVNWLYINMHCKL